MPRQLVLLCRIWRDADERRAVQHALRARQGKADEASLPLHLLPPSHHQEPSKDQRRALLCLQSPFARSTGGPNPVIHFRGHFVASVKTAFAALRQETGIEVTPHTLRHTAITWAMQAGVPIHEAVGYFGVSRQTMERVYIHHHPDHLSAARAAMERKR